MRAMLRWVPLLFACLTIACATGEEAESVPPVRRSDASATTDTSVLADSSAPSDTTVEPIDTGAPPTDTGVVMPDTSVAMDTAVEPDTTPIDTGTPDTGTPDTGTVMDTAAPTCAPSGEYGGTCKTNLDCAAITGCGYVCCAYEPTGTFSIGCGRIAFGGVCLP